VCVCVPPPLYLFGASHENDIYEHVLERLLLPSLPEQWVNLTFQSHVAREQRENWFSEARFVTSGQISSQQSQEKRYQNSHLIMLRGVAANGAVIRLTFRSGSELFDARGRWWITNGDNKRIKRFGLDLFACEQLDGVGVRWWFCLFGEIEAGWGFGKFMILRENWWCVLKFIVLVVKVLFIDGPK
jgi:hypothetical protein